MTEHRHTPAPWTAYPISEYTDAGDGEIWEWEFVFGAEPKDSLVFRMEICGHTDDDMYLTSKEADTITANMSLASAAPDLLAACEAGLAEIQAWHLGGEFGKTLDKDVVEQILAAIAKATGTV